MSGRDAVQLPKSNQREIMEFSESSAARRVAKNKFRIHQDRLDKAENSNFNHP